MYLYLERGEGWEKERESNINVRQKHLPHLPQPGAKPTTQACVPTRNEPATFQLCWKMPNQLSHTSQGSNIILNSQYVERTQTCINWWMNKYNVVYLYKGILFSNKKKWNIDICYNMNESLKSYAKHNKPVIRTTFRCNIQNRQIYRERN